MSNPGSSEVEITVESGDGAEVTVQSVGAGELVTIELPRRDVVDSSLSRQTYRVDATGPVTLHQFNPLNYSGTASNDASLLLPSTALGTEYMYVGWPSVQSGRVPEGRAYVTIIATQDATTVEVTPTAQIDAGSGVAGIAPGTTETFTMERGQVLQLATRQVTGDDLSGTYVSADAPIAAFAGHECADIPLGTCCCDHVEEQLFPARYVGHVVRGDEVLAPRHRVGRVPHRGREQRHFGDA